MASIAKRTRTTTRLDRRTGLEREVEVTRWRARFCDADGHWHARHFEKKNAAEAWLKEITAAQVTGTYCDPAAGKVTFREYAEAHRVMQPHRASSRELAERQLRLYVYPVLGHRPMAAVRPSEVQAFVTGLGAQLEPSTIRVVYSRLVSVFGAAVRDRIIAVSPCDRIALPEVERRRLVPLTAEQVWALEAAAAERYRALVVAAAGLGLRHGELTGLAVDRVDFLGRRVVVDQQLVTVSNREPYLGPVKSKKSRRIVPLPATVANALAAHIAAFTPGDPDGRLLFTTEGGRPISRGTMSHIWTAMRVGAGLPAGTRLHDLRHGYASFLIRSGESPVVVSERLGHANPGITLGVYSHLFPDDDERTRSAIDGMLAPKSEGLTRDSDHPAGR